MIDQIIIMSTESRVVLGILGTMGLVAGAFAVYYISFAINLIVASAYSGFKLIPESYRIWREDMALNYGPSWGNAELGITMPDGGEPVDEK